MTNYTPLTDESPMPYGKYAGKRMIDVLPQHLLWLYGNKKCSGSVENYIVDNLERLTLAVKKPTPQEKAKSIHEKFMAVQISYNDEMSGTIEQRDMSWEEAKKAAIIALDLYLEDQVHFPMPYRMHFKSWREIRNEIEKL